MTATTATTTATTHTGRSRPPDPTSSGSGTGKGTGPGFALLGAVQVVLIFTLASVAVPLPRIGAEFDIGRAGLILLTAAYGLSFAGLLLFGGRLADRYGGRRTLTAGLAVFGVASAGAAFAPGFEALLTARFVQGLGAAVVAPAAMALLRGLFPEPSAYGRAMATWGGLSVLGATAGNLLSGVISALLSWRWTFAVPVLVTALALALSRRLLPAAPPGPARSLDLPGAVLATAGITLVGFGLVLTDAHPWASVPVLVPLTAGLALLLGFPAVERRRADPLLPPGFLADRRRGLGLAAIAFAAAGTATVFVLLSLGVQQQRDYSALLTSAAFAPFAAALIGVGRAAPPLIGRYGPERVTGAGFACGAVGLALLAATGFDPDLPYAYGLLPGLLLLPAGTALSFAGAAVLATSGVPARQAGLAGGVLNTAMESGATVLFALLLALGSDAVALGSAAVAFAALAAVSLRAARRA
ncbi:MFS transporter [Streptomyces sp. NPDC051211]|uniref:MFS transporter n=1 Tax=Streptomyces sp. NPDC051211 TaxID=3154643 RepID=UPI00344D9FC1